MGIYCNLVVSWKLAYGHCQLIIRHLYQQFFNQIHLYILNSSFFLQWWMCFNFNFFVFYFQNNRYCRDGSAKPLWPMSSGRPSKADIPNCKYCGGPVCFEFQVWTYTHWKDLYIPWCYIHSAKALTLSIGCFCYILGSLSVVLFTSFVWALGAPRLEKPSLYVSPPFWVLGWVRVCPFVGLASRLKETCLVCILHFWPL